MIKQALFLTAMVLIAVNLASLENPDYLTRINMPVTMLLIINPTQVIEESTPQNYLEVKVDPDNNWIQSAGIIP